jgi:hypothetical protein
MKRFMFVLGSITGVFAAVLAMNRTESCKSTCVTEGPSWAAVGTSAVVAAVFLIVGGALAIIDHRSNNHSIE